MLFEKVLLEEDFKTFRSHIYALLAVVAPQGPTSNVEVNNIGSAGQAGFTQWIVV